MENYKNLGGDSGVVEYEIGTDYIKVRFRGSRIYVYNYTVTGRDNVEHMKGLAKSGSGLNAFINKNVKKNYSHIE